MTNVLAQDMPTLGPDDYDQWESLGNGILSPSGNWLAVLINRVSDEGELRIHRTDTDSLVVVPFATRPAFSSDGTWLAYAIEMSPEEQDAAQKADEPVHNSMGLLNLSTGDQETINHIESFSFSDDGAYLAIQRYKPEDKESDGVDVVIRTMATGSVMSFGNVSEFAWQDEGHLLALTTDADGQVGNGVSVFDPSSGQRRSRETDAATYRSLSWREESADLAVLKTFDDEEYEDTAHVALAWRDLDQDDPDSFELDPRTNNAFPNSMRMVEFRTPSWSEDSSTLFVGIQDRRPATESEEDAEEESEGDEEDDLDPAGVEIWHSLDLDPVPQQRVREQQLRRVNFLSAWSLDQNNFVQLGDDLTELTSMVEGGSYIVGRDESPYDTDAMFRQQFFDLYAIDVATGDKTLIEDRLTLQFGATPNGRYVVWFEGEAYYSYNLSSGEKQNITENVTTQFVNLDLTPTREQMPPFGIAGFLESEDAILLNDKWDVWEVNLDGSGGRALTFGSDESIRYRLVDLDPDADEYSPDAPLYYSTYGEWTKQAGYARARAGDDPEMLLWEDRSIGRLQKAENADVYVLRQERVNDSPD